MNEIKKSNNHIIKKKRSLVKPTQIFYDFPDEKELYEEDLKKLAMQIYDLCANDPDILRITMALRKHSIKRCTWYEWRERYVWLQTIHEECMLALADKLFSGAVRRKFDGITVNKHLHVYDKEVDEINKYWSKLNTEDPNRANVSLKMEYLELTKDNLERYVAKGGDISYLEKAINELKPKDKDETIAKTEERTGLETNNGRFKQ